MYNQPNGEYYSHPTDILAQTKLPMQEDSITGCLTAKHIIVNKEVLTENLLVNLHSKMEPDTLSKTRTAGR